MTTLCKVLPLALLCAALSGLPLAAQTQDCSFTYTFTGDSTQTGVSNLSGNTPCVNWRITLSTDAAPPASGTLSSTVTLQTSPDNVTWSVVPNTVCSSTTQPPCILQGANPMVGTQGMMYVSAYSAFLRVVVTGSSGAGHGTVRGYGAKGASASAGSIGGGGSGNLTFVQVDPVGACLIGVPDEQNTVTGALLACIGPGAPGTAGTWGLIIAANSSPLTYFYTSTASSIATYLQATAAPFTPKTTLTFAGLAIGTAAFQNWATNAGVPGLTSIPAGPYVQHIHAAKTAGGNVTLHTEFWEVSSTGVDIAKIGTTEESALLPGTEAEFTLEFVDGVPYTLGSVNSRIVGRVFATVTGFAATIQVFVGGTADSGMSLPSNGGGAGSLDPGAIDCADASGSTTAYTCPVPSPVPTAYATGQIIAFKPQTTNSSTTPTLNVAGLGVKNLVSSTGTVLTSAQLAAGTTYIFEYDGASLRLISNSQASVFDSGTVRVVNGNEVRSGTILYSALSATAVSQEVIIQGGITPISGNVRWDHILMSETTQFTGVTGLTVSMGRPGSNNTELSGSIMALLQSSGDLNFWNSRPSPPQLGSTYTVVLNFSTVPYYSVGTLTATNGLSAVAGAGTTWTVGMTGMMILIDGSWYTFTRTAAGTGTISPNFGGSTNSGKAYVIQNFVNQLTAGALTWEVAGYAAR